MKAKLEMFSVQRHSGCRLWTQQQWKETTCLVSGEKALSAGGESQIRFRLVCRAERQDNPVVVRPSSPSGWPSPAQTGRRRLRTVRLSEPPQTGVTEPQTVQSNCTDWSPCCISPGRHLFIQVLMDMYFSWMFLFMPLVTSTVSINSNTVFSFIWQL